MFSIQTSTKSGFAKIILADSRSKTSVEILPACGAILHAFNIETVDGRMNIVEQYESENDFRQHVESKGFKSAKLSPFVCRLAEGKYIYNGQNYAVEKFFLNNDAIHGLIYDAHFIVEEEFAGEDCARLILSHAYRGEDKGYPFRYNCIVKYELFAHRTLRITTDIVNTDGSALPIADGWHPYFTLGGKVNDWTLQFKSMGEVEMVNLLPTGKIQEFHEYHKARVIGTKQFDNCYLLDFNCSQPMAVLSNPTSGLSLEIRPDNAYPFLQVYTPEHRKSIAIENLSSAPDALNNNLGLIIIPMGAEKRFVTEYKVVSQNDIKL